MLVGDAGVEAAHADHVYDMNAFAEANADLKRLLDDGKNLYAYDRARNRPLRPITDYFLTA